MTSETEEICQSRPIDLPLIPIDSEFDSSDCTDPENLHSLTTPSTPATPTTPITPATPLSQLTTSEISFTLSDSETSTFSVKPPKRAYTK